jgi:hypothetical protein
MQADFAPRFPLKVLHRVGDVNHGAVDTSRFEALIQQLTGRPHEWSSLLIFAIARLFAHKKHPGVRSALAEYYLRRVQMKIAPLAMRGRLPQAGEIVARGQELRG